MFMVKLIIANGRDNRLRAVKFLCQTGVAYYGLVSANAGVRIVVEELKELRLEVSKLRIVKEQRRDLQAARGEGDNKAARGEGDNKAARAVNTPSWFKILTDLNNAALGDSEYTRSLNTSSVAKNIVPGGEDVVTKDKN